MTTTRQHQRFGFFVESSAAGEPTRPTAERFARSLRQQVDSDRVRQWIEFPDSRIAYLTASDLTGPVLVAEAGDTTVVAVLEALAYERQLFVAMAARTDRPLRVNGSVAPPAAILRVADQVEWDEATVLHLSIHRRPYVGPARPQDNGNECPMCRQILTDRSVVLACANCDVALHCETPGQNGEPPLECARVASECPRCTHALVTEEGFAYVPED
jgi:hypothetical protein